MNFQESSPWYFRSTATSGARGDWVPSQHQGENKQTKKQQKNKQTNKRTNKQTNKQKNKKTKEQSSKQHQGEINKWANI